ncbi:hypothetical protein [Mucilaginibacter aquaedulcis]|uniref:hypothetical protein n=1 Tax=Mucilaginibacter aquaedulcis TaxID=1187081 RepID=UPI0025B3668A|nr:hypothetical protein [Mucilaginibacter aquaedulcis]MDN3551010.1 hypothetical protein [Mucilaginibacter aquaedulcis]
MMEKAIDKEKEFFHLISFTDSDLYIRYRRLSEFQSVLSIANKNFTEQVAANILNQDNATKKVYLERLTQKFNAIDLSSYIDHTAALSLLAKHKLEWRELNAFYRTLLDFYILDINEAGVIEYHNKEPDIPTDYDAPEMAFLNKGIGFMTSEDARKSHEYNEKYGQYTKDVWDIFSKDIMPQKRFLELLPLIYGIAPLLGRHFSAQVAGAPLETLLQLQFYIFNSLQRESLLSAKAFIDQTRKSLMKEQGTANFDNFDIFIKSFDYNYPYKDAVISSLNRWKTNLQYLKKEILENLIFLSEPARKAYLKRIKFSCDELMENAHTPLQGLDNWLEQYETSLWEAVDEHPFINTELNKILASEPETFKESFEPEVNKFSALIRQNFYNYFYGYYLEQALAFINEQDDRGQPSNTENQAISLKLRSTLTVSQLSYLFKLLMDEGLFDYKHKAEVYKFIASGFETRKSSEISADSVKNHMDSPELKNIEVIHEKVLHLMQLIKKDKENF